MGSRMLCCTYVPESSNDRAVCADDLTQNGTSSATQLLDGLITITDPQLFSDGSAKIRNTAVGAALTATGLSYSPCMVVSAPAGDSRERALEVVWTITAHGIVCKLCKHMPLGFGV